MRHTARGLLIRDKKILLVSGHDADFFWTPGGGIEEGETVEQALHREIMEELGVTISTFKPFSSYQNEDQKVDNFVIEIIGEISIGGEITKTIWYSTDSAIELSEGFKWMVLPELLEKGLIE